MRATKVHQVQLKRAAYRNDCERHTQLLHSQKLANAIASPLPQKKNGRPALLS